MVAALAVVDAAPPNYRIALVDILVLRTKNPLCFGFAAKAGPFRGTGNSVLAVSQRAERKSYTNALTTLIIIYL